MSQADRSERAERAAEVLGRGLTGQPISRRQALGRMSALATAGAAAWVAPEIITAKPAAGASTSSPPGGSSPTGSGTTGTTGSGPTAGSGPTTSGATTSGPTSSPLTNASLTTDTSGSGSGSTNPGSLVAADQSASPLAFTGANLERDAAIGAALVAGGWALHRWASRSPKVAADAVEATVQDPPQTA